MKNKVSEENGELRCSCGAVLKKYESSKRFPAKCNEYAARKQFSKMLAQGVKSVEDGPTE